MKKLIYEKLDTLTNYYNLSIDKNDLKICRLPLFHGTTLASIESGIDVIQEIHRHSLIILRAVKKYYLDNISNNPDFYNMLEEYRAKTNSVFCDSVTTTIDDICNFSYGDFYVTTNYLAALIFSEIPMGELGNRAYFNAIALKALNIELGIDESIQYIIAEYDKFKTSKRIILMLDNALFDDLLNERGGQLDYDFLYKTKVSENISITENLRVNNISKYVLKLIPEELFKEGIKCFTKIKDVDKFLAGFSDDYPQKNSEKFGIK